MQVVCHRLGSHNSHCQLKFPILAFLPWHTGKPHLPSLWAQGCSSQRWGKQQKPSCFLRSEPGSVWQPRESASQPQTTHVMSKYSLTKPSSTAICYLIRLATTSLSQSSPSAFSLPKETVTSKTHYSESHIWFLWSQALQCPHYKVTTSCSYLGTAGRGAKQSPRLIKALEISTRTSGPIWDHPLLEPFCHTEEKQPLCRRGVTATSNSPQSVEKTWPFWGAFPPRIKVPSQSHSDEDRAGIDPVTARPLCLSTFRLFSIK